tara:strand:+ start:1185 stop:1490 length:306 start_codon:yes stop_codon:yes gene_type:complete
MGLRGSLEDYLEEVTRNVRDDRALAKTLLIDAMHEMKNSDAAKKEYGPLAAKYIENLQRSNEQLVKLSTIVQRVSNTNAGLSAEDKSDIYDMIKDKKDERD